jgi:hypothetical protein
MRHVVFEDGQVRNVATRYCKVIQEGPLEFLFGTPLQEDVEGGEDVAGEANEIEVPKVREKSNGEISNFRAQGFVLNDNNQPAPENLPTPNDAGFEGTMCKPYEMNLCR